MYTPGVPYCQCSENVTMSGAHQHHNVRMGTYTRVSGILKANRPVYRLAGSSLVVYLSYFGTNSLPGNWWLSRDYRNLDNDAVISSTSYAGALCPEQERTWQAITPTGWLNPYPNLTVTALLASPTTAAPTRAPTAAAASGAPYGALTATSCVAACRSPAANCRCHGLCESLLGPAGCAESVTLSGAEAEQPTRMGTYSRVPGLLHPPALGRPVYQRVGYGSTVYLWYHADSGNWLISNTVGSVQDVASTGRNQAACPEQELVWAAWSPSANAYISPHPTLRIRVADVGARIRSRPSAAVRAARPARRVPKSVGVHMRRLGLRVSRARRPVPLRRCSCELRCCEWPRPARCHGCCRGRCHNRHGAEHAVAVELRESLRTRGGNVHVRGRLCR